MRYIPGRVMRACVGAAALAVLLASCTDDDVAPQAPAPGAPTSTEFPGAGAGTPQGEGPDQDGGASQPLPLTSWPTPSVPDVPLVAAPRTTQVATKLSAPWGVGRLPDGTVLVSLRDEARLVAINLTTGTTTPVTGPGASDLESTTLHGGEGGLLGVAISPKFSEDRTVFMYRSTEAGNEVVRAELDGSTLGAVTTVLEGIPGASNHNGGALRFGPDRALYIGTGDAGKGDLAQNVASLAGKILRVHPDGSIPLDNPLPGTPLWSLGHRNVQGIDWDAQGRMYASEFGASTFDELNLITQGGNYGWPEVEGPGGVAAGFIDPLVSWPTKVASPSGLAVTSDAIYLAGLRGERLWRVPLAQVASGSPIKPQALVTGEFGRLRAVVVLPGEDLLIMTNNTDGRGDPGPDDDRLIRLSLTPSD